MTARGPTTEVIGKTGDTTVGIGVTESNGIEDGITEPRIGPGVTPRSNHISAPFSSPRTDATLIESSEIGGKRTIAEQNGMSEPHSVVIVIRQDGDRPAGVIVTTSKRGDSGQALIPRAQGVSSTAVVTESGTAQMIE